MRELTPGQIFKSRYQIKRKIGQGGMGVVFEAIDLHRDQLPCALKVLRTQHVESAQHIKRFYTELKLLTRLRHEHIVRVFDADRVEDLSSGSGAGASHHYIVMELLEGENLGDWIKKGASNSLSQMIQLITQALLALEWAHHAGVIHRDLKPDNLFITRDHYGYLTLKILDFGIAKDLKSDREITSSLDDIMIGTPHYMSPEQVRQEELTPSSDLYSMGVIIYQMIRGHLPFSTESAQRIEALRDLPRGMQVIWQHLHSDPPQLNFEPHLDLIVARLLTKNPTERVDTARSLRLALQEWVAQHPQIAQQLIPDHLERSKMISTNSAHEHRVEMRATFERSQRGLHLSTLLFIVSMITVLIFYLNPRVKLSLQDRTSPTESAPRLFTLSPTLALDELRRQLTQSARSMFHIPHRAQFPRLRYLTPREAQTLRDTLSDPSFVALTPSSLNTLLVYAVLHLWSHLPSNTPEPSKCIKELKRTTLRHAHEYHLYGLLLIFTQLSESVEQVSLTSAFHAFQRADLLMLREPELSSTLRDELDIRLAFYLSERRYYEVRQLLTQLQTSSKFSAGMSAAQKALLSTLKRSAQSLPLQR